jgi:exodeoxyribonuclease VIII
MTDIHVVVDIETLGFSPDAVILSIGAASFEMSSEAHDYFYTELDHKTQYHRAIDRSIQAWWQEQEAQGNRFPTSGIQLSEGLYDFVNWLKRVNTNKNLLLWSNGTDFDISILSHAIIQQYSREYIPWKYNAVRDYRTLRQLFPEVKHVWTGPKHVASSDAINEAVHLKAILNHIAAYISPPVWP